MIQQIKSNPKINWFLNVEPIRSDGYHELQTVMQKIDIADLIIIKGRPDRNIEISDINSKCGCPTIENIIYKAVKMMQSHYDIDEGLDISIQKEVPVAAGLGGGSANGAAIIKGLCERWSINPEQEVLRKIATQLGADVPFFLGKSPALCTGIGEIIEPLDSQRYHLVLWKSANPLSTIKVYQQFDQSPRPQKNIERFLKAYASNDIALVTDAIWNNLSLASLECMPQLQKMLDQCCAAGSQATWISGSGPTIVALASSRSSAIELKNKISQVAAVDDYVLTTQTI